MENKAIIIFRMMRRKAEIDLEIPLDISANDLVQALNRSYQLGIHTANVEDCHLKSENPIALLKGDKTLKEYGIHNGTIISFTE